jgi:hypothetical protein
MSDKNTNQPSTGEHIDFVTMKSACEKHRNNIGALSRRNFLIGSTAVFAAGVTACNDDRATGRGMQIAGGVAGVVGSIIALPVAGLAMPLAGGVIVVAGSAIAVYGLLMENGSDKPPVYHSFGAVSLTQDRSVPSGQVRVKAQETKQDLTPLFFLEPRAKPLLGGTITNGVMPRLHYRCLERVRSLPFSYSDILSLKHRAKMFNIPCDDKPTPVGGGRYVIAYGGVDWQDREFVDRSLAQKWYRVFSSAPGFEIDMS